MNAKNDLSLNQDFDGAEERPHQVSLRLADALASLPETVEMLGKPATTIAQVIAWAAQCGFDPKTGHAKVGFDQGGAVLVTIEGVKHTLFWRAL